MDHVVQQTKVRWECNNVQAHPAMICQNCNLYHHASPQTSSQ